MAAAPSKLEKLLERRGVRGPGRPGHDPCGTRVAAGSATASSAGTVSLPLERQGLSMESRHGRRALAKKRSLRADVAVAERGPASASKLMLKAAG